MITASAETYKEPSTDDGPLQDVLVIPRRLAPRMSDLTAEEVSDLFQSVQVIGKTIEKATNAKSLTIACQVSLVQCLLSSTQWLTMS